MKTIYIIGAGGVGSWLAPSMSLLAMDRATVVVFDGDKIENGNLNRQLFEEGDIGENKAEALAGKYDLGFVPHYYSHGSHRIERDDWILCCVDNNAGRKAVLQTCDEYRCKAIFGANETHSAEAYYYEPSFEGKPQDPRVCYPEIITDDTDDPRHGAIGCTGEAQVKNRQLVSANFMAAALMQQLYVVWAMERPKLNKEAVAHLPTRIRQNLTRFEVMKG